MRNVYLVLLMFVVSITAYGQNKSLIEESSNIVEYNGLGDPMIQSSNTFHQNQQLFDEINMLSEQLAAAKESENIPLMRQLEAQINSLSGSNTVISTEGPQVIQANRPTGEGEQFDNIGITRIETGAFWATATTTQKDNGRIWVAATKYVNLETDTLRIYYSDDGGISWTYFQGFEYIQSGIDFRTDDLDIEVLSNGSDWYVYVTGSYNYNGEAWGFVSRYKDDGTGFYYANLPKNTNTSNYWTRVVSDYPRFTGAAYIYIVSTMDSNVTGATRKVYTRAFVIQNPYDASPTLQDRNNGPSGSSYWWYTASAPDSSTLKSDVAYYDSTTGGGSTIVTCSIFENHGSIGDNIYMTYSDNFMATVPFKNDNFSLTYQSSRPIMSFGGDVDQMKGCIVTMRNHVNGPDVDPRYIATSNGGFNWTQGYVDASTDTTHDADVICLRGVDGHFKFAWTNRDEPNPEFLYRTGYFTTSLLLTPMVEMYGAGIYPDDVWGGRAGYRLTGSDSCFAVFEGPNGSSFYGVSGCTGSVVGIQNINEIPARYSLDQNYPNPFNPSTSIRFELPTEGTVRLKVFDVLGKEVATLVNERRIAGAYIVDFNASGLSSGVYFYKLEVNDFSEIKKMTLIK